MAEKRVPKTDVQPGALAVFEVEGNRVAVANVGGSFHAFDDTCTHRQCSLAEGTLEGTTVTCPCHGGAFDVMTGAVLSPPPVQPVRTYAVAVDGDTLKIEA